MIGLAVLSGANRCGFVNGCFASDLGYAPSELTGKDWAEITHPDDRARAAAALDSLRSSAAPSAAVEPRLVGKPGNSVWFEILAARLEGDPPDLLMICRPASVRRDAARGLSVQHIVSRILVEAASVNEAIDTILQTLSQELHWSFAAYWEYDPENRSLSARNTWKDSRAVGSAFQDLTLTTVLPSGAGIPGAVFEKHTPLWESDVAMRANFPRRTAASAEGLHAAFALPIRSSERNFGVIEFLSQDLLPPDQTLINAAEGIGLQIGQFMERQAAQSAGRETEMRKASILDTALDCIITIDADRIIREFNPAAEKTFGYRKEDVIGLDMTELIVPPALREAHKQGIKRYIETGESRVLGRRIEIRGMRSDGSEFPIELAITRVPVSGPIFFTAYLRDVSERHRAEKNQRFLLRASEELSSSRDLNTTLATIARLAVPDIADWCAVDLLDRGELKRLAVAHVDPRKIDAVAELEKNYPADPTSGFGVPAVIRTGVGEWAAEIPESLLEAAAQGPAHLSAIRELGLRSYIIAPLKTGAQLLGALTLVTAESGRRFTESDNTFAVDLARRMAVAIENAKLLAETEAARRRLEEQAAELEVQAIEMEHVQEEMEATNEELARANEELLRQTAEAERAVSSAQEADRAKSQFLAAMSHELRTPLNAIAGYAELIKLGIRGPVTELQLADLERIERSQAQLLGLVNDVLKFAKLQSGTLEFLSEEIPVADALRSADELVRPQITAKGLVYKNEGGDPRAFVRGDPDRFQQVILNLLTNAVKFTEPEGTISVSWTVSGKSVAICVTDTGLGIAAEKIDRIFDPFVQVSSRGIPSNEGVGLGLAISREIAERMNGRLSVKSEEGKGSTFALKLPGGTGSRKKSSAS